MEDPVIEWEGSGAPGSKMCRPNWRTLILVQCYGSSWGYTIWFENTCEGGEKNPEWTRETAQENAIALWKETADIE